MATQSGQCTKWTTVNGGCHGQTSEIDCIVGGINTLRPRQNGRHFADDIFKHIFYSENVWFSIEVSLKFLPKCPINNISALVQIVAWRRPGDKPLSEPLLVSLIAHTCITRSQWVNTLKAGLFHKAILSSYSCDTYQIMLFLNNI